MQSQSERLRRTCKDYAQNDTYHEERCRILHSFDWCLIYKYIVLISQEEAVKVADVQAISHGPRARVARST